VPQHFILQRYQALWGEAADNGRDLFAHRFLSRSIDTDAFDPVQCPRAVALGAIGEEVSFRKIAPVVLNGYARSARLVEPLQRVGQELFRPFLELPKLLRLGAGADDEQDQD